MQSLFLNMLPGVLRQTNGWTAEGDTEKLLAFVCTMLQIALGKPAHGVGWAKWAAEHAIRLDNSRVRSTP